MRCKTASGVQTQSVFNEDIILS